MRAGVAVGAAALLLAGCTGTSHPPSHSPPPPVPSTHVPLVDGAHIQRLHGMPQPSQLGVDIVDGNRLTDLDTHRTQKIAGLPSHPLWVTAYSVSSAHIVSVAGRPYVLSAGDTRARPIASNVAWMAPGLHGIWLTRGSKKCTLSEVSTTGRTIVPARPINCKYQILEETQRGLIANTGQDQALLDQQLHPTVRGTLVALAGKTLITTNGKTVTAAGHTAPLPGTIGDLDELVVSPDNRYVAVNFGNPACPGPRQCLDTWILRLSTMRWIHPPSMPVAMYLKPHDLYWGPGDRFSWLGTFDGVGAAVATWQPGATALRMRQISLPDSQYGVLHS